MEQRRLGASGLLVSAVGVGCNNFGGRIDLEATRAVVDRAIDRGITLFDTADVYGNRGGSETALGEILGPRRKDIVLATKFGLPMDEAGRLRGGSRGYLMRAVEDSLRRLRTDWIDLYQFHTTDPGTPIEETLRALDDLVRSGKVRYIGWSNTTGWRLVDAVWTARSAGLTRFVSTQEELSLLERRTLAELLPAAEAMGVGLLPYFPLASGALTGKYRPGEPPPEGTRLAALAAHRERYLTEANWALIDRVTAWAEARGRTLLEAAFAWLLAFPAVGSVIAGATRPEQIDANVAAGAWRLTPGEKAELDQLLAG